MVLHVAHWHVDLELGGKVYAVVVLRDLVGEVHPTHHRGLIGPASRHVPQGVPSPAEEQGGDVELLEELCGQPMSPD